MNTDDLMFEVHLTVASTHDLASFQTTCREIGVKPIILDLYTDDVPIVDVMTSSHMKGTTDEAREYSRSLIGLLEARGYQVIREKIETVPWHPAALSAHLNPHPSRYFEAHLAFLPSTRREVLDPFIAHHGIRLSRNKMKKYEEAVLMGTYRRSSMEMAVGDFLSSMDDILIEVERLGIALAEKPVTEFALYDSNDSHDAPWILA